MLNKSQLADLFSILIVAPILIALGTDRFPESYKWILVVLAIIVVVCHGYRLIKSRSVSSVEGLNTNITGTKVHYITMFDSSPGYNIPVIRIAQGDVIIWKNIGELDHSVVSSDDIFDSGYMKPGDSFSVQFNKQGTYYYYDADERGWMHGVVIVN